MYQYSKQYEGGIVFNTGGGGGTADYAFMLLLGVLVMLVSGSLFGLGIFFGRNMIYYVLYVWSKRNPTAQVSLKSFIYVTIEMGMVHESQSKNNFDVFSCLFELFII